MTAYSPYRILAIDANEYYNNTPGFCVVAGNIKDETMEWEKQQLADAMLAHLTGDEAITPEAEASFAVKKTFSIAPIFSNLVIYNSTP